MIPAGVVIPVLASLDKRYLRAKSPNLLLGYAKHALIEASGWAEESIDSIALNYLTIKSPTCHSEVADKINKIYGLDYKKNFRPMFRLLVGSIKLETIETLIGVNYNYIQSALGFFTHHRNSHAHTYLKPVSTVPAPSVIIHQVRELDRGLAAFESELIKI